MTLLKNVANLTSVDLREKKILVVCVTFNVECQMFKHKLLSPLLREISRKQHLHEIC